MLRVFPITLMGAAKRWVKRLPPEAINTWDLLKQAFIQRYCPPSKIAKQLEEIHNFKQEGDETLYQAWERYNDLLYKCPTYDLNIHQKGPIPNKTPGEALEEIQTMADHSQKWHDGSNSRKVSSGSSDGIAAIANNLDSLGHDMTKLKENVHAIQVGCQPCGGDHLEKECSLHEDVKSIEEVKYGEFGRSSPNNSRNSAGYHVGPPGYYTRMDDRPPSGERKPSLTEIITKYMEESAKKVEGRATRTKIGECKAIFTKDGLPLYIPFYYSYKEIEYFPPIQAFQMKKLKKKLKSYYVAPYEPSIPFPRRLKQHAEEALVHKTMESLKKIKESHEEIDYRCHMLDQGEPWEIETIEEPNKERDIDLSSLVKTINDKDNLDGIVDCLELKSHDDFIDINDEAYKKEWERYTKVMILEIKEMPRTNANIAVVKAELLEEMDTEGSVQRET
ncbi:cysteine-rich receptor-like protein kinase [Tanacetum coccineum]